MIFIKKLFIFLFKGLVSLLLILTIALVVIFALEIKVKLNYLNKPVEIAFEQLLDRDLSMNGDVVLTPSLWPTLEIDNVSIANPKGKKWQSDKEMLHFGRLRLQIGLISLLSGKIHIADMTAEEISLNLESDTNGVQNWNFDLATVQAEQEPTAEAAETITPFFHLEAIKQIIFKKINVHYSDQALNKSIHFILEKLEGSALPDKEIDMVFNGQLDDKEFSVKLKGGGLDVLRDKNQEWPLTMHMNIAGTDIKLSGALKQSKNSLLTASLEVGKTDIGATLSWFEIMDGLQAGTEHLTMTAQIQGESLSELIQKAELLVVVKNAHLNLTDTNTGGQLPIKIKQGTITIAPEKAVQIELNGLIEQSKIKINVTGAPIIDYTRQDLKTPLILEINTHNTDLTLKTTISKSVNVNNLGFNMQLKGQKLSDLNLLTKMDLPPLGPYELKGYFTSNKKGYKIKNLLLSVKDSQLKGDMLFDTMAQPPLLKVNLKSQQVQINNFDVGEWSPEDKSDDTIETKPEQEQNNNDIPEKLLSYETLSRFDVNSKLLVERVLSGKDTLGRGSASLAIKNARLNLSLDELVLPGGDASASLIYHPSGKESLDIALLIKVTSFDYGILARRIDAKSKVGGLISLDIELSSLNAKSLDSLLANSQGHLDFAWIPNAMNADLFEMWAINIMSSLLKNADKDDKSKVNCVIARLKLDKGMMREHVIFADTTKMRMAGTAEANFIDQTIKVKVSPKAKKAEFFSLATPVGVAGHFDNFKLSVNPLGLTSTAIAFMTSPLHVPIRRLFEKGLPEDGIEACKAMWEASEEIEIEK